jgi:phage host-nuclease inhibitor protein Gam
MTKRITQLADEPVLTREQADEIFGQLDAALLRQQAIQGEIDAAALVVRQKHSAELAQLAATIESHKTTLKTWSKAVRKTLFPKGMKSLVLTHGTLSFRTGQYTVGFLKGWTEEQVIEALGKARKRIRDRFLRVVTELNREGLIARRSRAKFLANFGICFKQSERFHIDPKLDSATPALKEAA